MTRPPPPEPEALVLTPDRPRRERRRRASEQVPAPELRLGRWQDVMADVGECDALITDPPYSPRTHAGRRTGAVTAQVDIPYQSLSQDDAHQLAEFWSGRVVKWIAIFGDHVAWNWRAPRRLPRLGNVCWRFGVAGGEVMKEKLERIVQFRAAYDKRNPDPAKNYGIHGVTMIMALKGSLGAVTFVLYTDWHLPHVRAELEERPGAASLLRPLPADIGYHSPKPRYEGHTPKDGCEYLDGKPCYGDGSALQAEEVFQVLVREGDEALWKLLEQRYHEWLG